ncbi:MAG: YMGG-like glycine zipper-containing protein [Parvularculaceae bacterium]
MRMILIAAVSLPALIIGCTESRTAEKNALYGAAAGAAAGAVAGQVISGKPGVGAAIGAGVGAVSGAAIGCTRAKDCFGRARDNGDRRFDRAADRYYYVDPNTGDTYWDNGDFRSYGPR